MSELMEERGCALVLGATGGYGGAMVDALLERGWRVRALTRGPLPARGGDMRASWFRGAIEDREALARAARGVSIIVHGANPPYPAWRKSALPMARAVGEAAAAVGATILFPGNVYALRPGADLDEDAIEEPPTRKGEIRASIEAKLAAACERGARLVILRGGDFYGSGAASSWMTHALERAVRGGAIVSAQPQSIKHAWAYLPDFARAHARLAELGDELAPVSRFHFGGHAPRGDALIAAYRSALGDPDRPARALPWLAIRALGLASPMMREVGRMRYLWDRELTLCGARLRARLEYDPAATSLEEGVRAHVRAMERRALA